MNTEHFKSKNWQLLILFKKYAIRRRASITEENSAFQAYANAYTMTYFLYQFERLNGYLEKHEGMKLNATVNVYNSYLQL